MLYQLNLGSLAQAKGFIFLAPNFRCLGPWKTALVILDILVCQWPDFLVEHIAYFIAWGKGGEGEGEETGQTGQFSLRASPSTLT